MPRTARASAANVVYHVTNRGNNRNTVFHKPDDYHAFLKLLAQAREKIPVRILGLCLMPNHFHLILYTRNNGDLSRFMQWLLTSHVRRYRRHHGGSGHVWQGRFKAFPIQRDRHLLIALRYVERNALRAKLVRKHAADWSFTSAAMRAPDTRPPWLDDSPVNLPRNWQTLLDQPQTAAEEEALRTSLTRDRPFGDAKWQTRTAGKLGLEHSLNPRGRPKLKPGSDQKK